MGAVEAAFPWPHARSAQRRSPSEVPRSAASAIVGATHRTVSAVSRQCSRTGCAERAMVTLTYQYGQAQVWLDDLTAERDPHAYDLCGRHAARLTVPQGWVLRDRRRSLGETSTLIAV
ncbi:MAG: DUF3499 family protein [Ilumatobacteraceae bacterium]